MIDSHCHLDFEVFDNDRQQVIERARQAGVEKIILAGVTQASWLRLQKVCEDYQNLFPCYGLHPYFIEQHETQHLDDLKKILQQANAVALGECGLDFYLKHLDKNKQLQFFEAQLDIAEELKLPVVIHSRKANQDVLKALKSRPNLTGMIHSFSGSIEIAQQFIKQGFYISLGAVLTYERASKIRKLAQQLPLDALLIESDSPDQPGLKHHGQRNEPAYIVETIKAMAELRAVSAEEIAEASQHNAIELFSLNGRH